MKRVRLWRGRCNCAAHYRSPRYTDPRRCEAEVWQGFHVAQCSRLKREGKLCRQHARLATEEES